MTSPRRAPTAPGPLRRAVFGIATAALAAAFAAIVIPEAVVAPTTVRNPVLSPTFLPYVLAGLVALFGIVHAAFALRSPEIADVEPGESAHPLWPLRLAGICALLLAYLVLPERIGMLATAVIATAGLLVLGGERRLLVIAGVAVLLPVAIFLFFTEVALVPLPAGTLFE